MRIAENVEMLRVGGLNLTLVWDDESLVLADAARPGQADEIAEAIAAAGFAAENLTHIVLTHQDMDHIGSVRDLLKIAPNAQILAHVDEAPFMDGRAAMTKSGEILAEELRFSVNHELTDGEILPIAGGIKIIHTPGHTPGHICLLLQKSGIMVLGDSASVENGELVGFNPIYIQDMELSKQSIEKIRPIKVAGYVGYHSGFFG
ncbi:MAG: MBL fold metallo-hydrolase [Clostridiales bacterium]|jgi:glyoxylase-like metal-dependent hydrolase (beta-lactamase superfamily II)|nr:MBL fold metallo-hydrolase [Clostridiales bacterium]